MKNVSYVTLQKQSNLVKLRLQNVTTEERMDLYNSTEKVYWMN